MTTIRFVALLFLSSMVLHAQEGSGSLADLARKERERKAAVAQRARVITSLDDSIDCGRNWSCFIQAVDDRIPAHMGVPDTVDLTTAYGWVINSTVRLDLRNCNEEACTLLGRTENTTLTFSAALRQRYLDSGSTPTQVEGAERDAEARVQRQDAARVTCTFHREKLKEFFARRRDGSTDDKDWQLADHCDGLDQTITNPSAPAPKPRSF